MEAAPRRHPTALERLRLAIKAGVDALERGEYTEVADQDLDAYLDSLADGTPARPVS